MIESSQSNKYLGMVKSGRAVMLVFERGTLTLDRNQPGWGVMPAADLQHLLPNGPSPRASSSSGHTSSDSSDDSYRFADFDDDAEDSSSDGLSDSERLLREDQAAYFAGLSDLEDTATSSSTASSDSESMPNARLHAPPADCVGWFPCDAPLHVAPVSRTALQAHVSATDPAAQRALGDRFAKGQLAPHPPADPAAGIMVALQAFGEPRLLAWTGHWAVAGDAVHVRMGLSATVAQALVAHAKVADHCNLAPVLHAVAPQFVAVAEDPTHRVMVFSQGLLVQKHPDPACIGWHVLGAKCRWELVEKAKPGVKIPASSQPVDVDWPALQMFTGGVMHWSKTCDFVAVLWSDTSDSWQSFRVAMPHGLIEAGQPGCPDNAHLREALQLAGWAPMNDPQRITGPFNLGSHRWQVPLPLGILRCLTAGDAAPELLHPNWHATLLPALERLLSAHKAQEKDWLAKGFIRQPVDSLLALARRDTRLRRPEVFLMWPPALIADAFKALAPKVKAQVALNPDLDAAQQAVTRHACRLFVFQGVRQPWQSVVVAYGVQFWADNQWGSVEKLGERVQRAFGPEATEQLVAIATLD